MELKNANSNSCNVVINILHLMILFFFKNIKNGLKIKDFKVYLRVENL